MRKITPTILLVLTAFVLSGCIGAGGGGSGGTNVASLSGTEDSFLDFYSSPGSGDDGGDDGSDEGDLGGTDPGPGDLGGGDDDGDSEAEGHHNPEPASLALMGAGLAALLGKKLRRSKMKTKILMMILAAGFIMMSANPAQAYVINGRLLDWGVRPLMGDWTPNAGVWYSAEDYVGPGGFVDPGYGGQQFDAEALYVDWDDTNLYLALVTGFPNTGNGITVDKVDFSAGDIAIDFGIDGNYDYALELGNHADNYWGYEGDFGGVYKVSEWCDSFYPETSPLFMAGAPVKIGNAGKLVYNDDYYGSDHWVVEARIRRSLFGADWNPLMSIHWTQSCGNDGIDVTTPEPVSGLLFGLGAIGALLRFRKKK